MVEYQADLNNGKPLAGFREACSFELLHQLGGGVNLLFKEEVNALLPPTGVVKVVELMLAH